MTAARTPHPHAKAIHAFADGFDIESCPPSGGWNLDGDPNWRADWQFRIKPEKVYPETLMSYAELEQARVGVVGHCNTNVANAAIRHAIDADQVVPMAEVQEVARNLNKSMHAKHVRDTAEAVFLACQEVAGRYSGAAAQRLREGIDIDNILAKVSA